MSRLGLAVIPTRRTIAALLLAFASLARGAHWPPVTAESRPWVYWWWMAGAVDPLNLTRELERYRQAGIGGVHIVSIYGAKGYEQRYNDFLGPRWIEMLQHTVREARRLGLGVDMSTGSGWNFGGPNISGDNACAEASVRRTLVPAGGAFTANLSSAVTDAVAAFGPRGEWRDLRPLLDARGSLSWRPDADKWAVYTVERKLCRDPVERAGPGGMGPMLNPFFRPAIEHYVERFAEAFRPLGPAKPRAMYHDSFEYSGDWAPGLLEQFARRRGYSLVPHLDLLFGDVGGDAAARVRSDYRETISDLELEEFIQPWVRWSNRQGMVARNQAHGSPGNWLDLYAAADIPETEMFGTQPTILISKFASSAAHVAGKRLTSAELGTWTREHFQERLQDLKEMVDAVLLAGVNHIFFHGTCYSPDDAPWPGWLFYASTQLNPRNPVWADLPALTTYIARLQSQLQAARPDNDLLVYWPLHDLWHDPRGLRANLSVHNFDQKTAGQSFPRVMRRLWDTGHSFDYVSDRQLAAASVQRGAIQTAGASYRAIVVPRTVHMPVETLRQLLALARQGAVVLFEHDLPADVPGLHQVDQRRAELSRLSGVLAFQPVSAGVRRAAAGAGSVLAGDVPAMLDAAGIRAEMLKLRGLDYVRVRGAEGPEYLLVNRTSEPREGWFPLDRAGKALLAMDPWSGRLGRPAIRARAAGAVEVYLQLAPGETVYLKSEARPAPAWPYLRLSGAVSEIRGVWDVAFVRGGPDLPPPVHLTALTSWTLFAGEAGQRFGGTARYSITFDAPAKRGGAWRLSLGDVRDGARVRLNGRDLGTLIAAPFELPVDALRPSGNLLEVDVTNLAANRIRHLDRTGVQWRYFRDINFVNIDYKPFDASAWPLRDSGLFGPVTLQPLAPFTPR